MNIKTKIMEYFFDNPTARLRLRNIERELSLPFPSVVRYCKELKEENILTVVEISGVKFYTSTRQEEFLLHKKLYNIRRLHETGLIDYLKKKLSNPPIILFGSYSKGEDLENSDIDIYIETPSTKKIPLDMFAKQLKREIQIIQHKSIKDISNPRLANNIVNGITINSFVEVFK